VSMAQSAHASTESCKAARREGNLHTDVVSVKAEGVGEGFPLWSSIWVFCLLGCLLLAPAV